MTALSYIGLLYQVERRVRGLRGEERRVLRERYSEPVLEEFHGRLERQRGQVLPKSPEGVALNYALSNWQALRRYARDGDLEIDNNAANAASGICRVMPTPGLCRAGIVQTPRGRRISDSGVFVARHNHRLSRKASSESVGRKRSGTALDGVACASAFSLSRMSA